MKFGSLFSGVGGFELGLERAGMQCAFSVEIDEKCRQTLKRHWPDVPQYEDVTTFDGKAWRGKVDLLCGGFPCQDLSIAGRRAGLGGARSGLFYHFARIIEEVKPEWIILENVPGLLSSKSGTDFAAVLSVLDNLGYLGAWRVLDAQYWGLAQRRKRVFIVGRLGKRGAAEVLLEPEGGSGIVAPSREKGQEVAGTLGGGSGNRGWACDTDRMTFVPEIVAQAISCKWSTGYSGPSGDEHHNLVATPRSVAIRGREGGAMAELGDEISNALRAAEGGSSRAHVLVAHSVAENTRGEVRLADAMSSLTSGGGKPGQGYPAVLTEVGVRRLMPIECERLQGFPDGWTDNCADTNRYKQLGNAVAVPVVEWIGKRIVEVSSMTRAEYYEKKGLTLS